MKSPIKMENVAANFSYRPLTLERTAGRESESERVRERSGVGGEKEEERQETSGGNILTVRGQYQTDHSSTDAQTWTAIEQCVMPWLCVLYGDSAPNELRNFVRSEVGPCTY